MNAWLFGSVVLVALIVVAGWLADRQADRGHAIRWEERFYQPQLSVRRGRVIDVDVGSGVEVGAEPDRGAPTPRRMANRGLARNG